MKTGIIFMTALVPTLGHERLIKFAREFMDADAEDVWAKESVLEVVISTRSFEPSIRAHLDDFDNIEERHDAICPVIFHLHQDDNAPQNCETDEEWSYWVETARRLAQTDKIDFLFGSDEYGIEFAKRLGATFVPCDPAREVIPVKGTNVRENFWENQHLIVPRWLTNRQKTFVLFGQESVGKTTIARALAKEYHTPFYHEFARPYIEMVGSDLTPEKMEVISKAQMAIDVETPDRLVKIQDTNILSTLGYYRFWPLGDASEGMKEFCKNFVRAMTMHTHFFIPDPEGVPFEEDQLRYGGNVRETEMSFWTDLLDEFGQSYNILSGDLAQRIKTAKVVINELSGVNELKNFKRD